MLTRFSGVTTLGSHILLFFALRERRNILPPHLRAYYRPDELVGRIGDAGPEEDLVGAIALLRCDRLAESLRFLEPQISKKFFWRKFPKGG